MTQPLNVALVGFGYAGQTFHAPLIDACEDMRLHTIVSSRPDAVRQVWPDANVVATLDQALSDPTIDLVVIATPNALHALQAAAALNAGKAVVVDKPFTVTLDEAIALRNMANSADLLLSVFQNRRWDADFLAVRALLDAGRLGQVSRFESRFDRFRPQRRDRWRERDAPGGGIWYDLGPHLLDQALVLFGAPLGVNADIAIQRPGDGADDYAHVVLRYETLRVVLHADMLSAAQPFRFAVHGDRASFVTVGLDPQEDALKAGTTPGAVDWGKGRPGEIVEGDTGSIQIFVGPDGDYPAYYRAIAGAIRGVVPNPVTADHAIMVMALIQAGRESSNQRAEVLFDEKMIGSCGFQVA